MGDILVTGGNTMGDLSAGDNFKSLILRSQRSWVHSPKYPGTNGPKSTEIHYLNI